MENMIWRKARASENGGASCVEIGTKDGHAAGIRDSKSPECGHLVVNPARLRELLDCITSLHGVRGRTWLTGAASLPFPPSDQLAGRVSTCRPFDDEQPRRPAPFRVSIGTFTFRNGARR